jgi:glutamate dehydrogenase (NADP+)
MLAPKNESLNGKTISISGFGNVAWGAALKASELGAKVVTISGPDGYVYDPDGISGKKVEYMLELRASNQDIVKPYSYAFEGVEFHEGKRPWEVKVDIALPCATQNELNGQDAETLIKNGVKLVAEVSNMGCTPEAVEAFHKNKILFAPGKAVNAGGVATSGLEMTQNAMKLKWGSKEVDDRLHEIMKNIHGQCLNYGKQKDGYSDYVKGANIAGFLKVANSMLDMGVI